MKLKLNLLLGFSCLAMIAYSQPPTPPATPIDGGLTILLVAGGLFGAKKISDYQKGGQS